MMSIRPAVVKGDLKEAAEEIVGGVRALDKAADMDSDGNDIGVKGCVSMQVGKYMGKMTLSQIYCGDKSYVGWVVLSRPTTESTTDGLMQLKVYIAHRDAKKYNRLAMEKLAQENVVPKVAKEMSPGTSPRKRQSPAKSSTSGPMETETDAWIRVDENPRMVKRWQNMVQDMIEKDARQKKTQANRCHRDPDRVRMIVEVLWR